MKKIIKSETDGATQVHQLTDLRVKEVSGVDRAANKRRFLVAKEEAPVIETPAVPTSSVPAVKTDVAPIPSAATVSADPAGDVLSLAEDLTKDATTIDVLVDGAGGVQVSVIEPAPTAAPASVIDAVKASVLAGIDAVSLRLATLRSNVEGSKVTYSTSGTPSELYDIWYIRDMLCALYDIGGPQWEIEQAGDSAVAATKSETPVLKNKVISKARIMKLQAAHKAMAYAHEDMNKVLKEFEEDDGTGETKPDASAENTDEMKADLSKAKESIAQKDIELNKAKTSIDTLQKLVADQGKIIAKARGSIAPSNVVLEKGTPTKSDSDKVVWPSDMASDKSPKLGSKNFSTPRR